MSYTFRDRYTPARHAWLRKVATGRAYRTEGTIGYSCMQLGWTQWNRDSDGEMIPGECLTESGRLKLQEWNSMKETP